MTTKQKQKKKQTDFFSLAAIIRIFFFCLNKIFLKMKIAICCLTCRFAGLLFSLSALELNVIKMTN